MSQNPDKDLRRLLRDSAELDEVPRDVSLQFEARLQELMHEKQPRRQKWITTASFALAAGFLGILGVSAVVNLESDSLVEVVDNLSPSGEISKETDVLTSSGTTGTADSNVEQYYSQVDYFGKSKTSEFPFVPRTTYFAVDNLPQDLTACLSSLGLSESVSLIDNAKFEGKPITAVWSGLDEQTWIVSIIAQDCEPANEVLIKRP
jgi:hypothetical protein